MVRKSLPLVAALALLSGCSALFGEAVKQPSSTVISLLYSMPKSADVMEVPLLFPGTRMRTERDGEAINWVYSLHGKDICRFTVTVEAMGDDASTVWTKTKDISATGQGFLCATVSVAGEESVAAALAGRPADRVKVETELAAALVNNMGSVHKTIGEEMINRAPKSTSCREAGDRQDEADCRQRDFNRRHEKQGN
jgi:hypothetical protein